MLYSTYDAGLRSALTMSFCPRGGPQHHRWVVNLAYRPVGYHKLGYFQAFGHTRYRYRPVRVEDVTEDDLGGEAQRVALNLNDLTNQMTELVRSTKYKVLGSDCTIP